jgi:hypothetical protein
MTYRIEEPKKGGKDVPAIIGILVVIILVIVILNLL